MRTGSKHKELTPRGMKIHVQHVTNLKQNLYGYDIDPFSNDAPRHLPTGKVTEAIIFFDIIRASELGLSQYKAFINGRLIKGTVNFYTQ